MILQDIKLIFGLVLTIFIKSLIESRHLPTKSCPQGCATCSTYNGCFACKPHFYFLLYRSGMKQIGVCTHACPTGYYQNRANDYYRCSRCRVENCATCFDKDFCAFCQPPYFSYQGGCVLTCPLDMYADVRTGDCKAKVDCTVAAWSPWSACTRNGRTCGYKYGTELRIREIVNHPTPGGNPCPELSEERKCRLRIRYCPGQEARAASRAAKKKQAKEREKQRTERTQNLERDKNSIERRKRRKKLIAANNEVE